jgi:site-specific DNA-cytosine methylase
MKLLQDENTHYVLDLCSGGGGFLLAESISREGDDNDLRLETVAVCDNDDYCQELLSLRFPGIPLIKNVCDVTVESLRQLGVPRIDGISGGFPCQPHAVLGKKKASEDERDLWPEIRRILREVQPRWAVLENVPGLLSSESGEFFKGILRDLDELGFDVEWGTVPCAHLETGSSRGKEKRFRIGVGGTHLRARIWIIAYANSRSLTGRVSGGGKKQEKVLATEFNDKGHYPQPLLCGSDDGLPANLGGYLLRHPDLDGWLTASTMPSFTREPRGSVELSPREIKALSPADRREYDQLKRAYHKKFDRQAECLEGEGASEYQELKQEFDQTLKEYMEARGLMNSQVSVLGNAIVPQVGAIAFAVLKERLIHSSRRTVTEKI